MKILISDFGTGILYCVAGSMLIGLFALVLNAVTSF
jgi:hypothetical protein